MDFNAFYRSVQFGTSEKNLTRTFINEWPDSFKINELYLNVDGYCPMNNTSGEYFVQYDIDNMYQNKTNPPRPYRVGDTSINWKKTVDLTEIQVLNEYDHLTNFSTGNSTMNFDFSRRL